MTFHTCPYCQSPIYLRRGQFPPHYPTTLRGEVYPADIANSRFCPVQWMPLGWRTTLRATLRGLIDITLGR